MNDSIAAKPTDGPADSTAAGTDPALTATAKLTPDSTCKCNGWFRVGLF